MSIDKKAKEWMNKMGWISTKKKLPKNCHPVIAFGKNSVGSIRRIRAAYIRKFELVANDDDDRAEYDEKTDEYYSPEGWYEWNEEEETHWAVSFPITHWMPFPSPPKSN